MKKAVVLLSGGMDSAVCMGIAARERNSIVALSFDYGQRHRAELDAARAVADHYHADHRIVALPPLWAGAQSSLTNPDAGVTPGPLPATFVPGRNLLFLSLALSVAAAEGAGDLFIGVNSLDYSGYPDCRPEFIQAFDAAARLALTDSAHDIRLRAPLQKCSKAEIVNLGRRMGVPLNLTVSCYRAADDGAACGTCDSCRLRREGFAGARQLDPTRYTV